MMKLILNLYHFFNNQQNNNILINKQFSLNYLLINTQTNQIQTQFHKTINNFLNIKPSPNNPNQTQSTNFNQPFQPTSQPQNNLNNPSTQPSTPLPSNNPSF